MRRRFRYIALALAVGLAIAVSTLAGPYARGASSDRLRGTVVWPAGVHHAPPLRLHDESGQLEQLARFRGRVVAVTFLASHCREACPVEGHELAAAQRLLSPKMHLTILIVSVDPSHDSARSARSFARSSGLLEPWHWLFGSRRALMPVWNRYGIQVRNVPGDVLHTPAVYLLDRYGNIRVADAVPIVPKQLAESVRTLYQHGHP